MVPSCDPLASRPLSRTTRLDTVLLWPERTRTVSPVVVLSRTMSKEPGMPGPHASSPVGSSLREVALMEATTRESVRCRI